MDHAGFPPSDPGPDGLGYVAETLFDRLHARQALLWRAANDGLALIGHRGFGDAPPDVEPVAAQIYELFDGVPILVRTPADPQRPAIAAAAIDSPAAPDEVQRHLDAAAPALSDTAHDVLEALTEEAAVLDASGVVIQTNLAWREAPAAHCRIVDRSGVGVDYPAALAAQHSRPALIAADGIRSVLSHSLPSFQSDYDAGVAEGGRAYSLHVDRLPTGGVVVRHVDISLRKHLQRQLAHRATHDALTGLPNRTVMADRLGQAMIRAARTRSALAVMFCDVDRFKQINDSQGHAVGDQVLTAIARRMRNAMRQSDLVARFGGDEFAVLLEDVDEARALELAHGLQSAASLPIVVDGRPLQFGLSIGVATHQGTRNPGSAEIATLLADADAAMYAAKQQGRGSIRLFELAHRDAARDPATIAPALRTAALNDEIRMLVQPIVELADGGISGFESLVRWDLPAVGRLSPGDFLQTAEETGAIVEIGRSILHQTLDFARRLPEGVDVSVNVSWEELTDPEFERAILDGLQQAGVAATRLDLEILLPANADPAGLTCLHHLRAAGVGVTVDAFGRQPVDLSMLPRVAASTLKVDRTLTTHAARPGMAARMLAGLVDLADQLGLACIAEGLETGEQAAAAAQLGFRRGQGFYFGKPVGPDEALARFG